MQLKVFSIRDAAAEVFNPPFYKRAMGEAERDFMNLANDEKSNLYQHPEHFDLYYLGDYDDNSGKFFPLDTPQHIVKAISVKEVSVKKPSPVQ